MQKFFIGAVVWIVVELCVVVARSNADDPPNSNDVTLDEVLAAYSKSAASVKEYDVYLSAARTFEMKSVAEGPAGDPPTSFKWIPYGADEIPDASISRYRQVVSREGQRRIEELNEDGTTARTIVSDGELVGVLNGAEKNALVTERRIRNTPVGEDYQMLYRLALESRPFESIFSERKDVLSIEKIDRATGLVKN